MRRRLTFPDCLFSKMAKMAICDFAGHLRKHASHGKRIAQDADVATNLASPILLHGYTF
jgi:hypothetical protein